MANPKTIEELLKMKPCPFKEGERVNLDKIVDYIKKGILSAELYYCHIKQSFTSSEGDIWQMPDGYYHLPPDKQLGLPLGCYRMSEIKKLVERLPFGVIEQYTNDVMVATVITHKAVEIQHFLTDCLIGIHKQPPNLYNPLDQQEKVMTLSEVQADETT